MVGITLSRTRLARILPGLDTLVVSFVSALFGFAAIDKLVHAPGFINAINSYAILPIPIGRSIAPLVIASELVVACGLLFPVWRRAAAQLGFCLMLLFTVGLVGNSLAGVNKICGCWFSVNMGQGQSHFVLNGVLLALTLMIARKPSIPDTVRRTA